jgi:hypothetical protein
MGWTRAISQGLGWFGGSVSIASMVLKFVFCCFIYPLPPAAFPSHSFSSSSWNLFFYPSSASRAPLHLSLAALLKFADSILNHVLNKN